jgi:hypothetical protein
MHLTLSPVRGLPGQAETTLAVAGDVLTADGIAFDLSSVPEGGQALPQGEDHPFIGPITRDGGTIRARLRVVLGDDAEADQPTDPQFWVIAEANGAVDLPVMRRSGTGGME